MDCVRGIEEGSKEKYRLGEKDYACNSCILNIDVESGEIGNKNSVVIYEYETADESIERNNELAIIEDEHSEDEDIVQKYELLKYSFDELNKQITTLNKIKEQKSSLMSKCEKLEEENENLKN